MNMTRRQGFPRVAAWFFVALLMLAWPVIGSAQDYMTLDGGIRVDEGSNVRWTITRSGPLASSLVVQLTSSDPTVAGVQAMVIILAGQATATFPVDGLHGPGTSTITASAPGYFSVTKDIQVSIPPGVTLTIDVLQPGHRNLLGVGSGTVTVNPPPNMDGKYTAGTVVTITAIPDAGPPLKSFFYEWGGDIPVLPTNAPNPARRNPLTVTMSTNRVITLLFSKEYVAGDNVGDLDYDGLPDPWEEYWGLDPKNPHGENGGNGNPDGDYIPSIKTDGYPLTGSRLATGYNTGSPFNNFLEARGLDGLYGTDDDPRTDPMDEDTDGDLLTDGWEYYFYYAALTQTTNLPAEHLDESAIDWNTVTNMFCPWRDTGATYEDPDGDCLHNLREQELGTDPLHWDTDSDEMPDGWEVMFDLNPLSRYASNGVNEATSNPDMDFMAYDELTPDSIHHEVYYTYGFDPRTAWSNRFWRGPLFGSGWEAARNTRAYTTLDEYQVIHYYARVLGRTFTCSNWRSYTTNPHSPDTDGDGMHDGWELYVWTGPFAITNAARLDPCNPNDAGLDYDGDGLNNRAEFQCLELRNLTYFPNWINKFWPTDPWNRDTDGDQMPDGSEATAFRYTTNTVETAALGNFHCFVGGGLNPTSVDTDGDHLPDFWEYLYRFTGSYTNRNGMDGTFDDAVTMQDTGEPADYDRDGLLNYQEYLTAAVAHWQYDSWTSGRGLYGYHPIDFFTGKAYKWDWHDYADADVNPMHMVKYRFIKAQLGFRVQIYHFSSTDPRLWDSDYDEMDDYYEVYHGLNPVYGIVDLVMTRVTGYEPEPVTTHVGDIRVSPHVIGTPYMDPDQDGLSNSEESLQPALTSGYGPPFHHHLDPTPFWITDPSYEQSWVNLYYWTGCKTLWFWDDAVMLDLDDAHAPAYAFSFESVEGFDTDNDGVSDKAEMSGTEAYGATDPLTSESPVKRRALFLNGDAAARTRGTFLCDKNQLHTFTVEVWVMPVNPASGTMQIIVERPVEVPIGNQQGLIDSIRLNFRIGLTETGVPFGEFTGSGYTPVVVNARAPDSMALQPNVWTHLALTYDGAEAQNLMLYINGERANTTKSWGQIPCNGWFIGDDTLIGGGQTSWRAPLVVGARENKPTGWIGGRPMVISCNPDWKWPGPSLTKNEPALDSYFQGWVDDIRIWDVARSQATLKADMRKRFQLRDVEESGGTLLGLYTFDDLPDPDHDGVVPDGFDILNGRPNDGSYPYIPFWGSSAYRSYVYNNYLWLPWIENMATRVPLDPPLDSPRSHYVVTNYSQIMITNVITTVTTNSGVVLTNDVVHIETNSVGHLVTNYFPNVSNPYNFGYVAALKLEEENHPDYNIAGPDPTGDPRKAAALYNDLLPLRYAVADQDIDMWDKGPYGYDTDGDGLPDDWELANGLDPRSAEGINGAFGDPDMDGLSNLAEYLAGTRPIRFDTAGSGRSDYDTTNAYGLTYGELYTDTDGMDDSWEQKYPSAANPLIYDAHIDPDHDGWSNYAEFMFRGVNPGGEMSISTDPSDPTDYPIPTINFRAHYVGAASQGKLFIEYYDDERMDGVPLAFQDVFGAGAVPVSGEYLGPVGTGTGQLRNRNILPRSVTITRVWQEIVMGVIVTRTAVVAGDASDGTLRSHPDDASSPRLGTIDYATGAWTLRSGATEGNLYASYNYTTTMIVYPYDFSIDLWDVGYVREGTGWFFAWIDNNANQRWDFGEPCGVASANITWGSVPEVFLGLTDRQPGYGRFDWHGVTNELWRGTNMVTVRSLSNPTAPQVLSREIRMTRSYFHENDFRIKGVYGLPQGSYQWHIYTNVPAGLATSGTFAVTYPATQQTPVLISPNDGQVALARSPFVWRMDPEVTQFRLQISKSPSFDSFVLNMVTNALFRKADGSVEFRLPIYAGDGSFTNGLYYWRVQGITPRNTSAWSEVRPFTVNLQDIGLGAFSIAGDLMYFGRALGGPIIMRAYLSSAFSGDPVAQITMSEPGPYKLMGLPAGIYSVLAFIDLNRNGKLDPWESWGFLRGSSTSQGDYIVRNVPLPLSARYQDLIIRDRDTDNDGLPDAWEMMYFGNLTTAGAGDVGGYTDSDGDGLNDYIEYAYTGTSPNNWDTDGDGLSDGDELNIYGTDPLNPDTDGDGLSDGEEVLRYNTDPLNVMTHPPLNDYDWVMSGHWDNVQPQVIITLPTTDTVYRTSLATVSLYGRVVDSSPLTGVTWANDRGGNGPCVGTTNWAAANIAVLPGTNVLTITATDKDGNVGTAVLSVLVGPVPKSPKLDFDGDGKADLATYLKGDWGVLRSLLGARQQNWGFADCVPVPADYDGDKITDQAVYHLPTGDWYIWPSGGGPAYKFNWGFAGCLPVPADYDGDGKADLAVYHDAKGDWYIFQSSTLTWTKQNWGFPGCVPVPADYDGDGKADRAVYHAARGDWYVWPSSGAPVFAYNWGFAGCVPVPADYNGDGKADLAVYHLATGNWYIWAIGGATLSVNWGFPGCVPVPADYDGDGKADRTVYWPAEGRWYVFNSSTPLPTFTNWGRVGSAPADVQYQLNRLKGLIR